MLQPCRVCSLLAVVRVQQDYMVREEEGEWEVCRERGLGVGAGKKARVEGPSGTCLTVVPDGNGLPAIGFQSVGLP